MLSLRCSVLAILNFVLMLLQDGDVTWTGDFFVEDGLDMDVDKVMTPA